MRGSAVFSGTEQTRRDLDRKIRLQLAEVKAFKTLQSNIIVMKHVPVIKQSKRKCD